MPEHQETYIVLFSCVDTDRSIFIEPMGTGLSKQEAIDYFQQQFGLAEISNGYIVCKKHLSDGTAFIITPLDI